MLSGTIEQIDIDISALVEETLSPAARSAALAAIARDALDGAKVQNKAALGYVPEHTTTVDGVAGASEDRVRPGGEIAYAFQLLHELIAWIRDQLDAHSPVSAGDAHPGLYKSSHALFADGQEIKPDQPLPAATQYIFLNVQPYARAIERGESSQAPTGVYEAVAALAQQRFGNQARIAFSFISPADGGIVDWATTASAAALARQARGGRRELHQDWLTRVPAIIVSTT